MTTLTNTPPPRWLDMLVLSLAFTLGAAGIVLVTKGSGWQIAAYLVMNQALFLAWAASCGGARWRLALRFALKTQLTIASRNLVGTCAVLMTALLCGLALNWLEPDPALTAVLERAPVILLATVFLNFALLSIPFVTMWKLHAILRRGVGLADLASGAYLRVALHMNSSMARVQARLDFYLRALTSDMATPLSPLFGVRPTLSSLIAADGKACYECSWTGLPAKLVIDLSTDPNGATLVDVRCVLRGGLHRHELAVHPSEAIMLLEHLQIHVLQPLRSDMAQQEAEQRQEKLRVMALEMRLKVLQAQVEPHFLFNTMANLRHLYRTDVIAGENMLNHLISYLRGAMEGLRSDQSTVQAELELIQHFLALMKIRMGERLSYTFVNIDDIGHLAFPPAMLISLVENAIKHGLQDKPDGQLRITAARADGKLSISVIDNGPGFGSIAGTGVGLSNIRQRLEAIYGQQAWLEVGALADGGFVSTLVVPAN